MIRRVYYLGDLKVHPLLRGSTLALRLLREAKSFIQSDGADLIFCTVAEGNNAVYPLLTGRLGFPKFLSAGVFRVFQLVPWSFGINKSNDFEIVNEHEQLENTYQSFYSRYAYGPVVKTGPSEKTMDLVAINGIKSQGKPWTLFSGASPGEPTRRLVGSSA